MLVFEIQQQKLWLLLNPEGTKFLSTLHSVPDDILFESKSHVGIKIQFFAILCHQSFWEV